MSDPLYDVFKDFVLPGITGLGSIAVGVGAIVVAVKSNALAEKVRDDEEDREKDAARERYREQLLRVVEPAVEAMLAHRAEVQTSQLIGYTEEGHLRSTVVTRLFIARTVATREDAQLVDALREVFDNSIASGKALVLVHVLGQMVLGLTMLLDESRDISHEVDLTKTWVAEGEERRRVPSAAESTSAG